MTKQSFEFIKDLRIGTEGSGLDWNDIQPPSASWAIRPYGGQHLKEQSCGKKERGFHPGQGRKKRGPPYSRQFEK